jgi:predicted SAM-dependent methyltransferase
MNAIKKILNLKLLHSSWGASDPGIQLKGDNVHCCCCGGNFITFLPFGIVKRANALCPNCGSLERHRMHWHYIINKTNLFKSPNKLKVLHVAPETIIYNKLINNRRFDYVPCAKFGVGYEDTYPSKTIDVDITRMAFEDSSFDVIYCSHVLEHIPNDRKAMAELYRVLKPGGWAMLQVPIDINREKTYEDFSITNPVEREKAFGQADHVRVYGQDYRTRLMEAGFSVKVENYIKEFTENEIFKNGFMKNEDLYICSKR